MKYSILWKTRELIKCNWSWSYCCLAFLACSRTSSSSDDKFIVYLNQVTKNAFFCQLLLSHTHKHALSLLAWHADRTLLFHRHLPSLWLIQGNGSDLLQAGDGTARRLKLSKSDRQSFWSDLAALWHKVSACVVWNQEHLSFQRAVAKEDGKQLAQTLPRLRPHVSAAVCICQRPRRSV